MKSIIVYFSYSGNNERLANHLRQRLNCDMERIVEVRKRKPITILFDLLFSRHSRIEPTRAKLENYDLVILVAPVWDAKIATPMKSFIRREKHNIQDYAFITICSGRKRQRQKLVEQLLSMFCQEPAALKELKVNDLLPAEQQGRIRYTTSYRVKDADIVRFEKGIEDFVSKIDQVHLRARAGEVGSPMSSPAWAGKS